MLTKCSHTPLIEKVYLSEKELSELTGLSQSWFQQQRYKRTGPDYLKLGDTQFAPIRYRWSDWERWVANHEKRNFDDND